MGDVICMEAGWYWGLVAFGVVVVLVSNAWWYRKGFEDGRRYESRRWRQRRG